MAKKLNGMISQILSDENMNLAWTDVLANKSGPGIDGISLTRWGRNWQANIARLQEQVMSNTYRPNRPRRFKIAKKGGGMRELSMLTVTDKVLQRAVLNAIDDEYERRFLKCSHGYRKNRSVATAAQQVIAHREQRRLWVLDADIKACFDNIDHDILMNLVERLIGDWHVLNLFELWLKAGRKHKNQAVGIPMGGVVSPLWCNIYLHQLDARLMGSRFSVVRYADDFVILTHSRRQTEHAHEVTEAILSDLKLSLHPVKTRITHFDKGFVFLGIEFLGDTYRYTHQNKLIEVQASVKMLWKYTPQYYGRS